MSREAEKRPMDAALPRTIAPPPPPRNVLDAIQRAAAYLERKAVPGARLDAEILLGFVLGRSRVSLYTGFDLPLAEDEIARYRELLTRRAAGEPTAYLLGEREFWSLSFVVDRRVLIPRPDTERLIELALERAPGLGASPRILDLCTGSGAIAVVLAKELPGAHVVAVELSADALGVARVNVARHGVEARVSLREGDLFAPLADEAPFALIVSNPPYVRHADIAHLQPEVAYHEPRLALDGGADGLTLIRRLLAEAPRYMSPGAWILCEIGMDQGADVRALATAAGLEAVDVLRDLAGHERTLAARKPAAAPTHEAHAHG